MSQTRKTLREHNAYLTSVYCERPINQSINQSISLIADLPSSAACFGWHLPVYIASCIRTSHLVLAVVRTTQLIQFFSCCRSGTHVMLTEPRLSCTAWPDTSQDLSDQHRIMSWQLSTDRDFFLVWDLLYRWFICAYEKAWQSEILVDCRDYFIPFYTTTPTWEKQFCEYFRAVIHNRTRSLAYQLVRNKT